MFGLASVMAEFQPGGGIKPYWRFDATRMLKAEGTFGFFYLLNEIGFILGIIYFNFKEFWKCYKAGPCVYFRGYWNMAEVLVIVVAYGAMGIYALRYVELQRLLDIFDKTYGNGYIRMEYAATLDFYFIYAMGFIAFLSTLKLIKLLQFNNRLKLLGDTIGHCWNDLRFFMVSFFISFFAFTSVFFFMFNIQLEDFADMLKACQMCFSMMLGKFDFESMTRANALAPFLFFVFSVSTSMVLINLMLTIIMSAFSEVKAILLNRKNKYDIMDFVVFKTRVLLGMDIEPKLNNITHPVHTNIKDKKDDEEFPDKVNMLLAYINDTYFHGQLDLKNTQALKTAVHRDMAKSGMARSGKRSASRSASFDRMFGDDIGVTPNFTHSAASWGRSTSA
ncbi:unnamed protein product [Meganyctiphanes norvegica]|uniref:Polycystin cation channel PKD1/PKD2 domain-containing protein n=1 Tax=Meganyctiphanes norvegica TaxID=48144 RepID=A0AAV2S6P6_MEGNR